MYLTTNIRLNVDGEAELLALINKANEVCNYISNIAFETKTFNFIKLQNLVYRDIRNKFDLHSHLALALIQKVAYAYKVGSRRRRLAKFGSKSLPLYRHNYKRNNIVKFYGLVYEFKCRPDVELRSKNQATLVYKRGKFVIQQPIEVEEELQQLANEYLGVDFGIKNIAVDSDGKFYSGSHLNNLRRRNLRLRSKLQSKGTKSAKRLLKKRRDKESRFARDMNHIISKGVVCNAKDTNRGVALEDLKGIRDSITVRKAQRYTHGSWGFYQLRQFIEYKSKLNGVEVKVIDPRNTSRTCPQCKNVDKKNRKSQSEFKCISCGYAGHADYIAAVNISWVAGNLPNVVCNEAEAENGIEAEHNCKCLGLSKA